MEILKKGLEFGLILLVFILSPATSFAEIIPLAAGEDLEARLNEAIARSQPGDEIVLPAGHFQFRDEVTLDRAGLRLRGQGADRTILDFKSQTGSANGILGLSDGLTFEDFTVQNTAGNSVKVEGANGVTFRRLHTQWEGKPRTKNGGYGVYPVQSRNVLVEGCEVNGASDAGIYVGQSRNIIVRGNFVHHNVAGIEIENSTYADVFDNEVTQNTGGILVFDLPDLPLQGGQNTRVFQNRIYRNNHRNFSAKGNILNLIPPGVGILVLANDNTEIFGNRIDHHRLSAVAIDHFAVTERPMSDPRFDPKPERIYVHDNAIRDSSLSYFDGTRFNFLINFLFGMRPPLLLVDGIEDGTYSGTRPAEDKRICFRNNFFENGSPATFGNMHLDHQRRFFPVPGGPVTRDPSAHDCSHSPIPPVVLEPPVPLPPPVAPADPQTIDRLCRSREPGVNWEALVRVDCPQLSDYRLFADPRDPTRAPSARGVPYALTTPLFTDYADKSRFIFVPPGKTAHYRAQGVFAMPVGTVISKTFSYPNQLMETRLLIRREQGWVALPYRWIPGSGDARLELGGSIQAVATTLPGGQRQTVNYQIPGQVKCTLCHGTHGQLLPIGIQARYLNRKTGDEAQLRQWASAGVLSGVPEDLNAIDTVPAWNDPAAGTLDARARGYLEVNCAHCHHPSGWARNTGLYLQAETAAGSTALGICKPPIAAGAGTGGKLYDIIPGDPKGSILIYRMHATAPEARMPQLGRSLPHEEGVALISDWIRSMPPSKCQP